MKKPPPITKTEDFPEALCEAICALDDKYRGEMGDHLLILNELIRAQRLRIWQSDFVSEIKGVRPSPEFMRQLQAALKAWINAHPAHENVDSAIHALGEYRDAELVPFLRMLLRDYSQKAQQHIRRMAQVQIAISPLGEDVLSDGSWSHDDDVKNLRDVLDYLKRYEEKKAGEKSAPLAKAFSPHKRKGKKKTR